MPQDPTYWLSEQIKALRNQVQSLSLLPALFNASSDGTAGWLKIFANAISGSRPALEFHYTGGGGDLLAQIYQDTGGNIRITGGLQVSGTKNFVMQHPTKKDWVLRHASTESPVNGVEYWGDDELDGTGTVTVKLPRYFEALTKRKNRVVVLTVIGKTLSRLSYEPIEDGAFVVHGQAGIKFSWLVKAERASQKGDWPIDFLAEEINELAPPPEPEEEAPVVESSPMVEADTALPDPVEPPVEEPPLVEEHPAEEVPVEQPPVDPAPAETP